LEIFIRVEAMRYIKRWWSLSA